MRCSGDPVRLGEGEAEPDERVEERQLVRHRGHPVVLDEPERDPACRLDVAGEEDALPRDQDVLEDGQRLDHLPARGDRMRERVVGAVQEVRAEELQPGRRDREGEPHRPVLLARRQRPRRDHDQLVGVRGIRSVHLGAADDDPLVAPIDDPEVEVWVVLSRRGPGPVALDVRLRDREREVAVAAMLVVGGDAVGGVGAVHDPVEGEERVGADLLDQDDERATAARRLLDQRRAGAQILRRPREGVVGGGLGAGAVEVERAVPGGEPELRVRDHVRDALAAVVDLAAVPEAGQIFVCRTHCVRSYNR
jgi:hypothetical protein